MSLLDTSCARVAVSQHATPPEVEDTQRRIEMLDVELAIIDREAAVGIEVGTRRADAQGQRDAEAPNWRRWKRAGKRKRRWSTPSLICAASFAARAMAKSIRPSRLGMMPAPRCSKTGELQGKLASMQGDAPLILPAVDARRRSPVVVADWTGIPVGRMVKNEVEAILKIADTLNQRVIGQRHGLDMIAKRIQTSRAKLDNPNKPIGVFMLVGRPASARPRPR